MNIQEAKHALESGSKVRRKSWRYAPALPDLLIFNKGRLIKATFEPMVAAIGEDRVFKSLPHIDAIYDIDEPEPKCAVGYRLTEEDIAATDWETVP